MQFADCLEILEATTLDVVSSYKHANARVKLIDSYWSSSDRVLVLFGDGQIRLYDFNLRQISANFACSLPALFSERVISKRSVLIAFKNLLLEMVEARSELNQENMLRFASKNLINNIRLRLCIINMQCRA